MIYTDCTVLHVTSQYAYVLNNDTDAEIFAWFPSVLKRFPIEGERVIIDKDDVDAENASFVNIYSEAPLIIDDHKHQLLSDEVLKDIALDDSQKQQLKNKTTGGVI